MLKKILSKYNYLWLIINIVLLGFSLFALVNSYVSHKYEVEPLNEPISGIAKVRTEWITEQMVLSKLLTIVFGINVIYILVTIWKIKKKSVIK